MENTRIFQPKLDFNKKAQICSKVSNHRKFNLRDTFDIHLNIRLYTDKSYPQSFLIEIIKCQKSNLINNHIKLIPFITTSKKHSLN